MVKYINLRMEPDGQDPFDFLINTHQLLGLDFQGNGFEFNSGQFQPFPFSTADWNTYDQNVVQSLVGALILNARLSGPAEYYVDSVSTTPALLEFAS